MNTERFDERQLAARRKGIALAFYVMITGLFLIATIGAFRGKEVFVSQMALSYFMILLGITVMTGYWIFKDAFLAVKETKHIGLYSLFYLILGLFMLFTTTSGTGKLIQQGQITESVVNFVALYWVSTGICLVIRNFRTLLSAVAKIPRRFYWLVLVEGAIVLISLYLNWEKEPDIKNLLLNFLLPAILLTSGVALPPKDHKIAKWIFILLGSFWFGYISLYYLIGFHNHLWQ
ncbi:hypothetical protein [Enterococcus diestrammenae]|uniref:Uncharacterized protein n=1 Tax=Enterococcus diestrammenae TaxID=1155073 RepID=A0ABV0F1H6_9ENTE|nr:hypothetical protein [Enterococcus diestrammenae]